jgi:hypothetical protein
MIGNRVGRNGLSYAIGLSAVLLMVGSGLAQQGTAAHPSEGERGLQVEVNAADGRYSIGLAGANAVALSAGVGVEVDGRWLHAGDYPRHAVEHSQVEGELGPATEWQVTYSGVDAQPDLIYYLRSYSNVPAGDIQVVVRNTTGKTIHVEAIRSVDATKGSVLDLGGPPADDRVLSDSFSEDRPAITIHNLADAEQQMHRGVGSQLIYNLQSHQSLFLGALTSDRFLTVLRLHVVGSGSAAHVAAYEVDATGTTELEEENSLKNSSAADRVELSLPVEPDAEMAGERVLFSLSTDYHRQLETYGSLIRQIDHARTSAPPLMGWWSWTAYYFGLNEGAALTNAEWEAEHLKSLGYNVYHVDEGYSYARGEYITPDASLFPHGLESVFYRVHGLGLLPAIWTAPFEVSERSWVYQNHPDWLVKNAQGQPIHAGSVVDGKDPLFVLDTTNPGAQQYLHKTYSTLRNQWGIRFIKMDFMDDSAIEGYYYKPNTTALEAQRIGLQIIREAVGDNFYLDKDGSPMLNTVGLVDYGRISQDTSHTFGATKEAASGMAARYYMNRNFFVSDPDAFTVSEQTIPDQTWHPTVKPASLDDAEVSMALAAVSGGMLEIGDDLPTLGSEPERLALVQNEDLIDMVKLGRSSDPVDLMTYLPTDGQPSIFLLKESPRQSILTIFNWTNNPRTHTVTLSSLGLNGTGSYTVEEVLDKKQLPVSGSNPFVVTQPAHSVRVLKVIDTAIAAQDPTVHAQHPDAAKAGETVAFSANSTGSQTPVVSYRWDFGDGVTLEGPQVSHAYTRAGTYSLKLTAEGIDGRASEESFQLPVTGSISTRFVPAEKQRYRANQ